MKKHLCASLALTIAFAITPSAFADSFGYKVSGANFTSQHTFDAGPAGFANGVAEDRDYAITGRSGTLMSGSVTPANFGPMVLEGFNTGFGSNSPALSGDGGFIFDNLLYPGNSGNRIQDSGSILVDVSGYELNLFSRSFGGSSGTSAAGSGHFSFADKGGYHVNSGIPKGKSELATATATLAQTPEPGSLFLLGTGLLFLALILFRRGAKRPTGS
jgi:hypothetical protein